MLSFSSQVVGKVQHGRLSKYFFEDLEAVYPAGKVVMAKILRSVAVILSVLWCFLLSSTLCPKKTVFLNLGDNFVKS